jgi:hypothetical protein
MAFTERVEHKLEIIPPWSIIQCRRADIIDKDGKEVGRSYHRTCYYPGDDLTDACQEVKDVAAALWNQKLIDDYKAYIENQALN